jgi:AcrR family transcriptional regulator
VEPTQRREQILENAAVLFGQKGYHATSISDIIRAAGIARGTFYLYFENKRAIFDELLDLLVVRIKSRINRVKIGPDLPSVYDQLLTNIRGVIEMLTDNREFLSIMLEGAVGLDKGFADKMASFYDQIAITIESSLKLGQKMELVRDCDTRIASLTVVGALKEVLHEMLRADDEGVDLNRLSSQILDIFARGVLVDGVSLS